MLKKFARFLINILLVWVLLIRVDSSNNSGSAVAVGTTTALMESEKLCEAAKIKLSAPVEGNENIFGHKFPIFNRRNIFCLDAGQINDTP